MRIPGRLGLLSATTALMAAAIGPAQALVQQTYDDRQIAYGYIYYADAEKTQELGGAADRCGGSFHNFWVLKPYIPTPYYDEFPHYICTGQGAYLPPDWPY